MSKKAVLFIHGFSAMEEDNRVFIEEMQKHKHIDIHTFILPGHGTKRMKKVKYQEWWSAAEKELQQMLKTYIKVTVVGHSMGTILAVNLAAKYSQVEKLVLIAPAYDYGNHEQNAKDIKTYFKREVNPNIGTGFEGIFHKLLTVPIPSFLEYRKLVKHSRQNIDKVKCPTLILHGMQDNIVPIHSSFYLYSALTCEKYLTLIENVRHQVFKSSRAKQISNYIYEYIIGGIHFRMKKKDIL